MRRVAGRLGSLNFLFLLIIAIEFHQTLYLIVHHRIPVHDTFVRFSLLYYFLNNSVTAGEIPQWFPQLTQGTTAAWFYGIQGVNGILANVLFLLHGLLKNVNFMPIFYFSMFFDKLILICGVWLLCRRYFSSYYTAFFVTVSVSASSLWTSQCYFNFYLYYALPLIIYLFHEFLDKGRWRYFCLGFNLFIMQIFGNAGYFIPVISLTLFLYFSFYVLFNFREVREHLRSVNWRRPLVFTLLFVVVFSALIYLFMKTGVNELAYNGPRRGADAAVDLKTFLTYGQDKGILFRWLELFLGFSPQKDHTLYMGIFMVPMILLALFHLNRRSSPIFLLIMILLLFSSGTFMSVFFYHSWPLMKFYRHLFLVSPLIRILLCFLGGFGFEKICSLQARDKHPEQGAFNFTVLFLCVLGILLLSTSVNSKLAVSLGKLMNLEYPSRNASIRLYFEQLICASSIKSFSVAALILFFIRYFKHKPGLFIAFILVFHSWDVYGYALRENDKRTVSISQEQNQVHDFQSVAFSKRRNSADWLKHPRAVVLNQDLLRNSVIYWTIDAYLFNEQPGTSLRTDHYQSALMDFIACYVGPNMPKNKTLNFPLDHPAARKFSGLDRDKIQFFSQAYVVNEKDDLSKILGNTNYLGDLLFLSGVLPPETQARPWSGQVPLSENQRLGLPYEVLRFDANHLEIRVTLPGTEPAWLFYSDVWHPWWKAAVNGKSSKIFKANLAYKSVAIQPGVNRVHFSFGFFPLTVLLYFLCLNSLFWVFWIARKTWQCLVPPQTF